MVKVKKIMQKVESYIIDYQLQVQSNENIMKLEDDVKSIKVTSPLKPKHPCKRCDYKARTKPHLRVHIQSIHEGIRHPCGQCDYSATTSGHLKTHIQSKHNGIRRHFCPQCDYKARTKQHLQVHIESVHEGIRHLCDQCDYSATTKQHLQAHIDFIHKGIKYPCNQCDYNTSTQHHLKTHVQAVHDGIKVSCRQCDKQFTSQGSLKHHVKSTHDGIKYGCKLCKKEFSQQRYLTNHIQKKHEGLRGKVRDLKPEKIECPTCGFICQSKENFRHHNRKHLTIDCHHCGKSLLKSSNFQAHQRRCTKDFSKYFPCTICGRRFSVKGDLDRHYEKRHTVSTLTKLYQCELCDFQTLKETTFWEHARSHRDLRCHLCNQKIRGYKNFLKHRQLHEQQEQLQLHDLKKCPSCDKQFMDEKTYVRHIKTHNFSKCSKCDYKTNNTFNLKAHFWRVHIKPNIAESEQSEPQQQKPKCSYCDYTSIAQSKVSRHQESCYFAGPEIFCIV